MADISSTTSETSSTTSEPRCFECGAFNDATTVLRVSNASDGEYRCEYCVQAVDIRHCCECGEENTELLNNDDVCMCCEARQRHPTLELPACARCPAKNPHVLTYGRCDECAQAAEDIIARADGECP